MKKPKKVSKQISTQTQNEKKFSVDQVVNTLNKWTSKQKLAHIERD